jgi:hypothetical protein
MVMSDLYNDTFNKAVEHAAALLTAPATRPSAVNLTTLHGFARRGQVDVPAVRELFAAGLIDERNFRQLVHVIRWRDVERLKLWVSGSLNRLAAARDNLHSLGFYEWDSDRWEQNVAAPTEAGPGGA